VVTEHDVCYLHALPPLAAAAAAVNRNNQPGVKKPVVFLQHGVTLASDCFTVFGANESMAYILADAGAAGRGATAAAATAAVASIAVLHRSSHTGRCRCGWLRSSSSSSSNGSCSKHSSSTQEQSAWQMQVRLVEEEEQQQQQRQL
jgi:hypothetical protein